MTRSNYKIEHLYQKMPKSKGGLLAILLLLLIFWDGSKNVSAQANSSVLYVPLIGLTSVPEPLAIPKESGTVTYNYAVKNFLPEIPLTDIKVADDKCSSVKYVEGDDNSDSKLDYSETWRYACTTKLSETTQSIAVATGRANNMMAEHKAYVTVVVGQKDPAPLVSIINITKVAYPLALPTDGGPITFTYKVNNPGVVPLADIKVTDDKCSNISSRLGDTNGNNLLDINEVWIYTCTANLTQTTTNTAHVVASANGLSAIDEVSLTVHVDSPISMVTPKLPTTGGNPSDIRFITWGGLSVMLGLSLLTLALRRRNKLVNKQKR